MPKIFNRAAFEVSNSDAARFCKLCFQPRSVGRFFEFVLSRPHNRSGGGISAQLSFRYGNTAHTQSRTIIKGVIKRRIRSHQSRIIITLERYRRKLYATFKAFFYRCHVLRNSRNLCQIFTTFKTPCHCCNALRNCRCRHQLYTTTKAILKIRYPARNSGNIR